MLLFPLSEFENGGLTCQCLIDVIITFEEHQKCYALS